eukprot:1158728-Pelagomonas_calceolata.AAC.6
MRREAWRSEVRLGEMDRAEPGRVACLVNCRMLACTHNPKDMIHERALAFVWKACKSRHSAIKVGQFPQHNHEHPSPTF